ERYNSNKYARQYDLIYSVVHAGAPSPNPQITVTKPSVTSEEPLQAELKSFLSAVRACSEPVVPLGDGRRALAVALDVVAAIREHGIKVNLDKLTIAP